MNNFTPEYIELAKNSRVQELRGYIRYNGRDHRIFLEGDFRYWVSGEKIIYQEIEDSYSYPENILLLTGDQLELELQKICDKAKINYSTKYFYKIKQWRARVDGYLDENSYKLINEFHSNPLIAKISLLISLLEGE